MALLKFSVFWLATMATEQSFSAETKQLAWRSQQGISVSDCAANNPKAENFETDFARAVSKIRGSLVGDRAIRHYLLAHQSTATLSWNVESQTLYINGKIRPATVAEIANAIQKRPKTRQFIVNSFGGDAVSAMAVADILKKHRIALTVEGFCMSACANYLLPAAYEVRLHNAVVALHGSAASCNEKLSVWSGIRKWGLSDYLEFRRVAKLDTAFTSKFPRLADAIRNSQQTDRGGKDGLARDWLVVPSARVRELDIHVVSINSTQTFDLLAKTPDDSLIGKFHIF